MKCVIFESTTDKINSLLKEGWEFDPLADVGPYAKDGKVFAILENANVLPSTPKDKQKEIFELALLYLTNKAKWGNRPDNRDRIFLGDAGEAFDEWYTEQEATDDN